MTEQLDETTTDETTTDETTTEVEDQEQKPDSPNREAAKYRTRLREVEAERDQLTEALTSYRRSEAERYAEGAGLERGADLFDVGTALDDLVGEDGRVDPEKVTEAAEAVLAERPHWRADRPRRPLGSIDQGVVGTPTPGGSWQDVLRNA